MSSQQRNPWATVAALVLAYGWYVVTVTTHGGTGSSGGRASQEFSRLLTAGGDHLDAQSRDFDLISSTLAAVRGSDTGAAHANA